MCFSYPYLKLERQSSNVQMVNVWNNRLTGQISGSGKGCQASHAVGHTAQSVGQTGMQWNRQSCSMTDCQAVGQTDKKWDRQSASEIVRHAEEQTGMYCDRQACNGTCRHAMGQAVKQQNRQLGTGTDRLAMEETFLARFGIWRSFAKNLNLWDQTEKNHCTQGPVDLKWACSILRIFARILFRKFFHFVSRIFLC